MRRSMMILAALLTLASAALRSEEIPDTIQNAIGNTIRVEEAVGDVVFIHLKANHRFDQHIVDPQDKGPWVVKGKKVCQRTPDGSGECHALTGKWWVKDGKICQKPDASPSNFTECHELASGKRIGDTWKQPGGPGGDMTFLLIKGVVNGP